MDKKKFRRPGRLQLIGFIIGVLVTVAFTIFGIKWVLSLNNPDKLAAFQNMVQSLGPGGWFVLLGIQYVQIVLAFIPGGPIQIVAGALYGPWAGLGICLLGTILATATVFALVQRFGRKIIRLFVDENDILKYKFLNSSKKLESLVLILFFIPGTPKDALTYLFALTPLPLKRFMLLSTIARIPGVLTSVLAGDSIVQGQWVKAGVMFGIITAISVGGIFLHKKIMQLYHRHKDE